MPDIDGLIEGAKLELVRGMVDESALAKNKYEVVFLKVKSELTRIC